MKKKLAIVQLADHREPAFLVAGQTVQQFGDGVAIVAFTLLVLDTTHSVSGLAGTVSSLGILVRARSTRSTTFESVQRKLRGLGQGEPS